jgi:prefoldin subunit 5
MALEDLQNVLGELRTNENSREEFRRNREDFLKRFELSEGEKEALFELSLSSFIETAEFIDKFNDAELSIGSFYIR